MKALELLWKVATEIAKIAVVCALAYGIATGRVDANTVQAAFSLLTGL